MDTAKVYRISELNSIISSIFNENQFFKNILVEAEVSNVKYSQETHCYFTMVEDGQKINASIFYYRNKLAFKLKDGDKVLVRASFNYYVKGGAISLIVDKIKKLDNSGDIYQRFLELKAKLSGEGLFDPSFKKIPPKYIFNLALVCADYSAALSDLLFMIKKTWPFVKISIYPSLVQGDQAVKSLMKALNMADQNNHDAIVLARGGGSFEDLNCFNDENLVRCIFNLRTFIITGIGHEVDNTLSDLVADMRANTPTAAIEMILPNYGQYQEYCNAIIKNMAKRIEVILNATKIKLDLYQQSLEKDFYLTKRQRLNKNKLEFQNLLFNFNQRIKLNIENKHQKLVNLIQQLISIRENKINNLQSKLQNRSEIYLKAKKDQLVKVIEHLELVNPLSILKRGYSLSYQKKQLIKSVKDIDLQQEMIVKFNDGEVISKVIEVKEYEI